MDMKVTTSKPRGNRNLVGLMRSTARKLLRFSQFMFARAMRLPVPFFETAIPPLGRKMRGWGWIWQPAYGHKWLNDFYENTVDPYEFDGTPYEDEKYNHTLGILGKRKYGRALEIGAAEGVFTERLAPYCSSLVAVEVADAAVARAKERLASCPSVTVVQAALPNQMPDGQFDLILASDVLYYFPKDVVVKLLKIFESRLNPGGTLFTLHYLGDFRQTLLGRDVHDLMKSQSTLEQIHDETVDGVGPREAKDGYTITVFRKPALTV